MYSRGSRSKHESSNASPAANPSSTSGDKYERFEQWLRDNGAQFDMLELCEYDSAKNSKLCDGSNHLDALGSSEEKKEPLVTETESEMRGIHAKSHILPNSICMAVPRKCLITVEMGMATPIGQAILQSDLDLDAPKHIFLMVYLLWDRKVNKHRSFFWPYYQILPQTLRNMPIFWSQDELSELQGSHLLQQIHDRNQAIAEDYYSICQIAPQLASICTLDEFKWARMCVCSRNFGLQIDGHRTSALVPHADMLNHYRPRQTKWTFDEDRQAFTITTLQHIVGGSQVYDSYGQKCNHRFLLNYGFAVEDNREVDGFCPNEVPVELTVDPEDELFVEKLDFWSRGDMSSSSNMFGAAAGSSTPTMTVTKRVRICVSNNENTRLLFSLLRALACNRAELTGITTPFFSTSGSQPQQQQPSPDRHVANMTRTLFGLPEFPSHLMQQYRPAGQASQPATSTATAGVTPLSYHRSCRDIRHPISLRNEKATMRLLLDIVHRHLSQYASTLAQDIQDLQDEARYPRYSNVRHAKIQVRGEKEVLHHYAHWARVALDVLDVMEEELNEERGSVEVQLTNLGQYRTEERPGFESVIRRMDDDEEVHHTILRYCSDVLGSLRREEFKNIRRARSLQQTQTQSYRTDNARWIGHKKGSGSTGFL